MQKHVLFYSNYCEYCKDINNLIVKKNVHEMFVFVCVDNKKYEIPVFVDRVPMVVTAAKHIVADDSLIPFIDSLAQIDTVVPIALTSTNTDQYTYIGNVPCDDNFCRGYVFLTEEITSINPPKEITSNSRTDDGALERYKNERAQDDAEIMKMQKNNI